MMKHVILTFMIAIALPVTASAVAEQSRAQDHDRAYKATKAAGLLPYSRIRKIAEKAANGKIISQKLVRTNINNWIYQLRIRKSDGRIVFAVVDAKSGKILSVK